MRRLERLNAMLRVPEVSRGKAAPVDESNPEIAKHRQTEAYYERHSTEAQRLSMELALLYHRDVFCEGGIWAGTWVELTAAGTWMFRVDGQAPSRRFLFHGNYRSLKIAPDLAQKMLQRDRGQPVPERLVPVAWPSAMDERQSTEFMLGLREHDPVEVAPLDITVLTE